MRTGGQNARAASSSGFRCRLISSIRRLALLCCLSRGSGDQDSLMPQPQASVRPNPSNIRHLQISTIRAGERHPVTGVVEGESRTTTSAGSRSKLAAGRTPMPGLASCPHSKNGLLGQYGLFSWRCFVNTRVIAIARTRADRMRQLRPRETWRISSMMKNGAARFRSKSITSDQRNYRISS